MFKVNLKWAKEIYRFDWWIGKGKSTQNEKKANSDPEVKSYIRAKRQTNNLPDCWDTRWIPKIKNWKHRSKVKHQYDKHKINSVEANAFYNNAAIRQQLLFDLRSGDWIQVQAYSGCRTYYHVYDYDRFEMAEKLVEEGLVEPMYKTITWDFDDFGTIITRSKQELIAIRLKTI